MKSLVAKSFFLFSTFLAIGIAYAAPLPYGLEMGMPLSELSKKVALTPYENTPNLYKASHVPNGPEHFETYYFLVLPEYGLCKITAATGDMQGSKNAIEKEIFSPREKELSDLYGVGEKLGFWSLQDGEIARTEWTRKNAPPIEPTGIYLFAKGNGKTGGVILYYESKNIYSCIEWNKAHGDLAQWKIESKAFLESLKKPEVVAVSIPKEKHPNLPKGFKGDSIVELIKKYEAVDEAAADEFTKKSEIKERRDRLRSNRPYQFIFEPPLLSAKYDAESEVYNIPLMGTSHHFILNGNSDYVVVDLADKSHSSSYVGQNSFGASAKITETSHYSFGLALANWSKEELLTLSLQMRPQEAKMFKADLAFFIEAELMEPKDVQRTVYFVDYGGEAATISNPEKYDSSGQYLLARINKIGAYRKSTGEVIGWKRFE